MASQSDFASRIAELQRQANEQAEILSKAGKLKRQLEQAIQEEKNRMLDALLAEQTSRVGKIK
jgi:mevalonate kinase